MDLTGLKVTIIGGGIGGLAASVALARKGARVRVLEQSGTITEAGAGIQIGPNGAAVLGALGLSRELNRIGTCARVIELRDYRAGRSVLQFDLARLNAANGYFFVHRADLIELLADAARNAGVEISLSSEAVSINCADSPFVKTRDGAISRPAILIGADGIHSLVREFLNGREAPFFTGHAAWRAVVPANRDLRGTARVFMGPGRHLVTYPLRGGASMNVVAVHERRDWVDESWSHTDDPANLRDAFGDFCPEVGELLEEVQTVCLWGLFRHRVAPVWHSDCITILGDAAHPMLPFLAQGAVMAIEDAWILADSLERAEDAANGLALYRKRRHRRVARVVAAASRNARYYHLRFPPFRLAAHAALGLVGAVAPGAISRKFDWLYGHNVTAR